jgi:hypothetical protein
MTRPTMIRVAQWGVLLLSCLVSAVLANACGLGTLVLGQ